MKVLCIDGSREGEVMTWDDGIPSFVVALPIPVTTLAERSAYEPNFRTEVYYINVVSLFGEYLTIASVKVKPDLVDVARNLLSDKAREVVR